MKEFVSPIGSQQYAFIYVKLLRSLAYTFVGYRIV